MDLGWITDYFIPIIILACLGIGYIIKKINVIDNKFIPAIVGTLGIIFGFITNGFTFYAFTAGLASGLASTGLYEAFKQLIGDKDSDDTK